jgi:hypothetical protein
VAASPQGTGDRITEIFPSIREFDESIPERARRHLREASNSIHSPGVSIVGSAAAIDAMLKARNYKTGRYTAE